MDKKSNVYIECNKYYQAYNIWKNVNIYSPEDLYQEYYLKLYETKKNIEIKYFLIDLLRKAYNRDRINKREYDNTEKKVYDSSGDVCDYFSKGYNRLGSGDGDWSDLYENPEYWG
jgi:hypothetical protein